MYKEPSLIITPRPSYKNPVCIRVSDEEKHWLDEVVASSSLSVSEVMRSLISIARANGVALGAQQPRS